MKQIVDIDQRFLKKLQVIAELEDLSVKALIERSVEWYIINRESQNLKNLSLEQKEDLGLLFLMQQINLEEVVTEDEIKSALLK